MNPEDVKILLEGSLSDCQIQVESEGSHYNIVAIGDLFDGKRAVQRQLSHGVQFAVSDQSGNA